MNVSSRKADSKRLCGSVSASEELGHEPCPTIVTVSCDSYPLAMSSFALHQEKGNSNQQNASRLGRVEVRSLRRPRHLRCGLSPIHVTP